MSWESVRGKTRKDLATLRSGAIEISSPTELEVLMWSKNIDLFRKVMQRDPCEHEGLWAQRGHIDRCTLPSHRKAPN